MNKNLDEIMANALKSSKELEMLGNKLRAENAVHLDKVDPKIKAHFEKEGENIDSLSKELKERLKELDNLKNNL